MKEGRQGHWQAQAYATLPQPVMTPRTAFQHLMAGHAEKVPLDKMANRMVARRGHSVSAGYSRS